MTFDNWTGQGTREQLTFSLADSPANPTALQESDAEMQTLARSGQKCSASYTKQSPLGWLVRMLLTSQTWDLTRRALTWKVKVTKSNHSLFLLSPSARRTNGNGSLLWRTMTAELAGARVETLYTKDGEPAKVGERAYRKQPDGRMVLQSVTLNQQVEMFPTPRTADVSGGNRLKWVLEGRHQMGLREYVTMYPTPRANTASIYAESDETFYKRKGNHRDTLARVVMYQNQDKAAGKPTGGQLNPMWVEWLMGYPLGWTDLEH